MARKAPPATEPEPAAPRKTRTGVFKQADVFKVARIVEGLLERRATGLWYVEGHSDETVSLRATEALGYEITSGDLKKLRQRVLGKLASEAMSTAERLVLVLEAQDKTAQRLKALADRVEELEARLEQVEDEETAPPPQPVEARVIPNKQNGVQRFGR